jgi:hypothetical protein
VHQDDEAQQHRSHAPTIIDINPPTSPIVPADQEPGESSPSATTTHNPINMLRRSGRKRKAPDYLKPKFKGKVYQATLSTPIPRKQRVPVIWEYPGKQRVSPTALKIRRLIQMKDKSAPEAYKVMYDRYRQHQRDRRNQRVGWLDLDPIMLENLIHAKDKYEAAIAMQPEAAYPMAARAMTAAASVESQNQARYQIPMPRPTFAPIYPTGPLNLNSDGTTISYKKSHQGPNAEQWAQADAEEMERLFTSGTLRPILFHNIPHNKTPTYVNPVCSEKLKDDGAVKLRTRATIGGDRIDYPYSTTAVTAELESIKILINAMISDDCAFSTVDIEDFYLGTRLPHPEYIRIPLTFLPKKVIAFYKLAPFLHKGALYCVVLKTHYGLPQAGALSQQRLFKHLEDHGYHQLFHAPALFRNHDGSIRFALVVDDFAVVWSSQKSMNHFLKTLRQLYTIKNRP